MPAVLCVRSLAPLSLGALLLAAAPATAHAIAELFPAPRASTR